MTGVRDDIVPALNRPRQQNQFVILATYITAPSPAFSSSIQVASSVGFAPGNLILIMLDTGVNFVGQIDAIAGPVITLRFPLPASVGGPYGDPIENSVIFYAVGSNAVPLYIGTEFNGSILQEDGAFILLENGTPSFVGTESGGTLLTEPGGEILLES